MLYWRPFVYVNDLFLDPEVQTLWSYTMAIGQFEQDIHLWDINQDSKDSKESPLYAPGTQVLIKVWKDGSPKAQLQPTWKGPYPVILSTPTAVHESSHGRKQKKTHNTCVSPWEISDTYSGLQMSVILMNTPKIKFLGIRSNFVGSGAGKTRQLNLKMKLEHSLIP